MPPVTGDAAPEQTSRFSCEMSHVCAEELLATDAQCVPVGFASDLSLTRLDYIVFDLITCAGA